MREVRDARRGDDRRGVQIVLAALQRGDEPGLERRHALVADLDALLGLEPVRVVEEALRAAADRGRRRPRKRSSVCS